MQVAQVSNQGIDFGPAGSLRVSGRQSTRQGGREGRVDGWVDTGESEENASEAELIQGTERRVGQVG